MVVDVAVELADETFANASNFAHNLHALFPTFKLALHHVVGILDVLVR